jgi:DNA-binding MarR family transcriptional regulator
MCNHVADAVSHVMSRNTRPARSYARGQLPDADADVLTEAVLTASRLLVAISARSLTAVEDRVTLAQFRLLVVLSSRGPQKISQLAANLAVNPSTATRMIDRLVAGGLVNRSVNPVSRREVVARLTPAGSAVVRQVTEQRRQEIAEIVARIPEPTRRGIVDALAAFAEAGGEPPAVPHAR